LLLIFDFRFLSISLKCIFAHLKNLDH